MLNIYYSAIGIFAIIIHIILYHGLLENDDERLEMKDYKRYLNAVFFYYLTDAAWGFLNESHNITWLYLDTIAYYITMGISVVLCCKYIVSFLKLNSWVGKAIFTVGGIFAVGEIVALVVNHFYHFFFWFNNTGEYQASTFRYFALLVQIIMYTSISLLAISAALKSSGGGARNRGIAWFCLAITAAVIAQAFFPLLPLYTVGLLIGTVVIHVFIISEERVSQLVKIRSLNNFLESKNKELEMAKRDAEDAKQAAEAASEAKTSFLFSMSHDIRTPMNAIIGFRDLLEKHQDDPVKRADYLQKIEHSSDVLLSIINNVLEMARIEKGTVEIEESAWSAEQFMDSVYSVFQEMMEQKNIVFTHSIHVEHEYVFCDILKMREILQNVVSNAYKYTKEGGKVDMCFDELPYNREGWSLYRCTVSDTGIGMSEKFLPHLFDEFSRENSTTDAKIEGTGLGMPIVKRFVELMNGTIEVLSRKGVGTTFSFTIPLRIAQKTDLVARIASERDESGFKDRRILLTEDNELNAEIAIEILKEVGFIVERAEDGQQCLEIIQAKDAGYYDLILMDVQMPRMNGYEATKAIRALGDSQKASIKILAMTANAFEEDKREAIKVGMDGHLAKPINVRELMRELARVLN